MRIVIYDDESMEPITVVNLPITDRDINQRGGLWRVPVPQTITFLARDADPSPMMDQMSIVELRFERVVRRSPKWGEQDAWWCFTDAAGLVMLLEPDFLPGQYSAVNRLRDNITSLERLLSMILR